MAVLAFLVVVGIVPAELAFSLRPWSCCRCVCARLVRTPRTPSPFSEPMPPAWCPCEGSQGEELQFLRSGLSCQVPKSNPLSVLGLRGSEHRTLAGSPMTKTEGGRNGRREGFCSAGVQPRPSTHSLTDSLVPRATPTLQINVPI